VPTDHERNTAGLERSEFLTANCFVRRRALEAIGGFDERFTMAWREDSDLHFRLLDSGGLIVRATDAVVVHPARPAPWGVSLKEQRKARFDALLFRNHPQRFRERIHPRCPWDYYVIVLAALVAAYALLAGWTGAALAAAALWAALTGQLVARRLAHADRSPGHIAEMIITSLAIPFLSVFWRLYGGLRYRVVFW
jgi:GT2 family glycosyltransferase